MDISVTEFSIGWEPDAISSSVSNQRRDHAGEDEEYCEGYEWYSCNSCCFESCLSWGKPSATLSTILQSHAHTASRLQMFFAFRKHTGLQSYTWTVWFAVFGLEMWAVMGISGATPGIGLQDTHLNVRMGLLTLIIIGEGVIAVTRIVNKTVRPGGWTKWSFVHILGVTSNVVCLGCSFTTKVILSLTIRPSETSTSCG